MLHPLIADLKKVKTASKKMALLSYVQRNGLIVSIAHTLANNKGEILQANARDRAYCKDHESAVYDRLILDEKRIDSIIESCMVLSTIGDPLEMYNSEKQKVTADGLIIKKIWVPLGVVASIYEARPWVTVDIAVMALKSGNAVILRWGSEAYETNRCLISLMQTVLIAQWIPEEAIFFFPPERTALPTLYEAVGIVDVIIPRGGKELIRTVRRESLVPVIETGAGVVHMYVDSDIIQNENAADVIVNAKVSRPSVCNSLDTLLIHRDIDAWFYSTLFPLLASHQVRIWVESTNKQRMLHYYPEALIYTVEKDDFFTEQLSLNLNICWVDSIIEALDHIDTYGSHHSDAILSDNPDTTALFMQMVDSAVVYSNTSTRFSDGGCFAYWWEVGISTQKLHARWPMGAEALVTYKYAVYSDWMTRR